MSLLCVAQSNSASLLMTKIIGIVIYIHLLPAVSLKQLTLFIYDWLHVCICLFSTCICLSESLYKVLRWLGFEVVIQQDCTSTKMLSLFQELARTSQRDWDCVMCCVLSHGLEGGVYGVDGNPVEISMLMEPFSGTNCPSMAGKPKIFFIQACQGNKQQNVVYTDDVKPGHGCADTNAVQAKEWIPSHADFLLGMATVPSFVSFRDSTNGTWYIQSLCHNLAHMVPR